MNDNTMYAIAALVATGQKAEGDAASALKAIGELVRSEAPEDPRVAELLGGTPPEQIATEPGA